MRFNDFAFESILNETGLKWNGLHTKYVQNIINLEERMAFSSIVQTIYLIRALKASDNI